MSAFVSFPNGDPRKKLAAYREKQLTAAIETVEEACLLTQSLARQNLTNAGKIDTGVTRASISFSVTVKGYIVEGVTFCGAAWGQWIEYGRLGTRSSPAGTDRTHSAKAAWPPVDAMIAWVRRHVKILAPSGRTKSGRARKARPQDIRSVAFLIGRKIYRFGIKPAPFMGPAFARVKPKFYLWFAQRVGRIK